MSSVIHFLIFQVFDQAPIFLGIVVLIGLLLQRKKVTEVFDGVIKTIVGYLILGLGAGTLLNTLGPIMGQLNTVTKFQGVEPANEAAYAVAMNLKGLASEITLTFLFAFIIHVFLVRIIPFKRAKNVYLTAHIGLFVSAFLILGVSSVLGLHGAALIGTAAVLVALYWTFTPMLPRLISRSWLNDELTVGHANQVGAFMGHYLGKWFGNKNQDAEDLNLPAWLSMFRDNTITTALVMALIFIGVAIAVGPSKLQPLAGTVNWFIWSVEQGLTFAAGVVILLVGVRMFVAAIIASFKGISDRLIPNAVPAVDAAAFYGYSPIASMLGFLASIPAALLVMLLLIVFRSPVVIFPSPIIMFFDGALVGVFGNKAGGWKGAILAGFVSSFIAHLGLVLLWPLMGPIRASDLMFSNIDFTLIWVPVLYLLKFIGGLFGLVA